MDKLSFVIDPAPRCRPRGVKEAISGRAEAASPAARWVRFERSTRSLAFLWARNFKRRLALSVRGRGVVLVGLSPRGGGVLAR